MQQEKAYELVTTGQPNHRHSLRDGVNRLLRALPGVHDLLVTVARALLALNASQGASGPHVFAVRINVARLATQWRPSQFHPAFVAIAIRPSLGWNTDIIVL